MKNTFKQLNQKQKLSNEVVKQVEDSIRNKVLIPTQKLPAENELCNIFGVSRTVIREALHMLDTKGLVSVKRGKKTVVNEYREALKLNPIQFFFSLTFISYFKIARGALGLLFGLRVKG